MSPRRFYTFGESSKCEKNERQQCCQIALKTLSPSPCTVPIFRFLQFARRSKINYFFADFNANRMCKPGRALHVDGNRWVYANVKINRKMGSLFRVRNKYLLNSRAIFYKFTAHFCLAPFLHFPPSPTPHSVFTQRFNEPQKQSHFNAWLI